MCKIGAHQKDRMPSFKAVMTELRYKEKSMNLPIERESVWSSGLLALLSAVYNQSCSMCFTYISSLNPYHSSMPHALFLSHAIICKWKIGKMKSQHFNIPRDRTLTVAWIHAQVNSHKGRHLESQALICLKLLHTWATLENIPKLVLLMIYLFDYSLWFS